MVFIQIPVALSFGPQRFSRLRARYIHRHHDEFMPVSFLWRLESGYLSVASYFHFCSSVPSFLLFPLDAIISQLAYESRKAKRIIASRDISYAFTNVMANNYYSLR
jgi:hypothetical protein